MGFTRVVPSQVQNAGRALSQIIEVKVKRLDSAPLGAAEHVDKPGNAVELVLIRSSAR